MIPKRSLLIIGTFLLAVLLCVDRICISTAKDGITQDLGLTDKQFGWVLIPWMIQAMGWRNMFHVLMLIGGAWAVAWYAWFRDEPSSHPGISREEIDYILKNRRQEGSGGWSGGFQPPKLNRTRNGWKAHRRKGGWKAAAPALDGVSHH